MMTAYRVCGVLVASLVLTASSWGQKVLNSPTEMVETWSPSESLYVFGDVGVRAADLTALSQWLGSKAPHWSVLVVEHARGLQYSAAGQTYRDLDALEYAVGHGVMGRSDFVGQINEAGERDGVVMVIALAERQFVYFAEDAYDKRSLGEDHWKGTLDRYAIAAMRSGGNVVRAVQDTASNVISTLDARRKNEALEAGRRQLAEKQRITNQGASLLSSIEQYQKMAATTGFVSIQPALIEQYEALGSRIVDSGQIEDKAALDLATMTVKQGIQAQARFGGAIAELKRAKEADMDPPAIDGGVFVSAQDIRKWNANLENARATLRGAVLKAEESLETRGVAFIADAFAAASAASAYTQAIGSRKTAFAMDAAVGWGGILFATFIVACWLVVCASRSLTASRKFKAVLGKWVREIEQKNSTLCEMLSALDEIPGLRKSGGSFTGLTKERAAEVSRLAGELFLMASGLNKLLGDAAAMARVRLSGMRWKPWESALKRLETEAIEIDPTSELEVALNGKRTQFLSLTDDPAKFAPMRLQLREVMEQFTERAKAFDTAYKQVREAWNQVFDSLKEAEQAVAGVSQLNLEVLPRPKQYELDVAKTQQALLEVRSMSTSDFVGAHLKLVEQMKSIEAVTAWARELQSVDQRLVEAMRDLDDPAWVRGKGQAITLTPGSAEAAIQHINALVDSWRAQVSLAKQVASCMAELKSEAVQVETEVRPTDKENLPVALVEAFGVRAVALIKATEEGTLMDQRVVEEVRLDLNRCRDSVAFYRTAEQTIGDRIHATETELESCGRRAERAMKALDALLGRFESATFNLEEKGMVVDEGNATAADNSSEVEAALEDAAAALKQAMQEDDARAFANAEGSLVVADQFLAIAKARIEEVQKLEDLIDTTLREAQLRLAEVQRVHAAVVGEHVLPPSIQCQAGELLTLIRDLESLNEETPLRLGRFAESAVHAADQAALLRSSLAGKKSAREQVGFQAPKILKEIGEFEVLLRNTVADELPDGEALKRAPKPESLRVQVAAIQEKAQQAAEWDELLNDLTAVQRSIHRSKAELSKEAGQARKALDAIDTSERAVARLHTWVSCYGHVPDTAAIGVLRQARDSFAAARFEDALSLASSAAAHAKRAIDAVESQEDSSRRAAEARRRAAAEATRRAAEAARRRASSSSSSSWSSGGSRSSFGSSSGGSRSSFSVRSGGARSGW